LPPPMSRLQSPAAHGKTTTSQMIAWYWKSEGLETSNELGLRFCGAEPLSAFGRKERLGQGEFMARS